MQTIGTIGSMQVNTKRQTPIRFDARKKVPKILEHSVLVGKTEMVDYGLPALKGVCVCVRAACP